MALPTGMATGPWEAQGDDIVLHTGYADKTGFTIESEKKYPGSGVVVKVENFDRMFYDNTRMFVVNGTESEEQGADREGFFRFTAKTAEKLLVSCVFFPDNMATIIPKDVQDNNYILKVNHDLLLVHFNEVHLRKTETGLEGSFPLLNMTYGTRTFTFREDI